MAKDWKPDVTESLSADGRLGELRDRDNQATYYYFRIGWREFRISRGEIGFMLIGGLVLGLIIAGMQTGYVRMPRSSGPALAPYDAPVERLLGSTEATRPGAGDPERNFLEGPGGPLARKDSAVEPEAAAAEPPTEAIAIEPAIE